MKRLLATSLLLICSCSQNPAVPLARPSLAVPDPESLHMQPVTFTVVTKDSSAATFEEIEKQGIEPVMVCLTGTDYKALVENILLLQRYILLQRNIIKSYRDYYEQNLLTK